MAKVVGLLYLIGSVINPQATKVLVGKSIDLIHSLFGVLMHQIATIQ